MKRLAPLAACLLLLSSCNGLSVAGAYLEADRLTYNAIAPKYKAYVEADATLDADTKRLRLNVLTTWNMRLEAQEQ